MLDDGFTPHGHHLIAGEKVAGATTFRSEPWTGDGHDFAVGTPELVDRAARAAEGAFAHFAATSREDRAAFLEAIAEEIEARSSREVAAKCAKAPSAARAARSTSSGVPTAKS